MNGKLIVDIGYQPLFEGVDKGECRCDEGHRHGNDPQKEYRELPESYPFLCPLGEVPCSQKGDGKVAHGGVMYDLGTYDGEKNQYHPKYDHHPTEEVLQIVVVLPAQDIFPEGENGKDRCREDAEEENHEMVERETAVTGILRAEEPYLIDDEVADDVQVAIGDLQEKPAPAGPPHNNEPAGLVLPP